MGGAGRLLALPRFHSRCRRRGNVCGESGGALADSAGSSPLLAAGSCSPRERTRSLHCPNIFTGYVLIYGSAVGREVGVHLRLSPFRDLRQIATQL